MKKVVFGLIATVMLSVSGQAQNRASSEVEVTHKTPKAVGSASTEGSVCFGWSFCNSVSWTSPTQTGSTFQTLNTVNKTMTFKIPFASMNSENLNFYHNKTTFELKNSTPLQLGERLLFGLKPTATYLPGVYSLVNDGYNIVFTVRFVE